jgi:hypothetical protein
MSGTGSAEEPEVLQRPGHACVDPSRGLADPKFRLSTPTGVQLAPTSRKLVKGQFSTKFLIAISEPCHVPAAKLLSTVVNRGCHAPERRHNQSEES